LTKPARAILPNRRAHELISFHHWQQKFHVGIGRPSPSGPIQEIWINTNKTGTQSETLARDSAVVLSIALQCGATIEMLRHAITRDLDGRASGPIGQLLDRLAGGEGEALLSDPIMSRTAGAVEPADA
jgi:ribonucleoside-diphosphate reductase alpha chain